jgi:hypothetical protein
MQGGRISHDQESYWNGYYRSGGVPELPSQFALFVAGELFLKFRPRATVR